MVSCIVVNHNIPKVNYSANLFQMIFYDDLFEINEYEDGVSFMFIYNVEKIKVWQVVLDLETEGIPVGFGFGKQKDVARKEALNRLKAISEMNMH